jgi:hypothetical protein
MCSGGDKYSTIDLGLFSKYRTELMGIATVLIILCHMPAHGVYMPLWIKNIIVHGGSGCDMFLFLSGLAMYHSYSNNNSQGKSLLTWLLTWLYRRYLRIFVPYLIIAVPCLSVDLFIGNITFGRFLLRLSTISFWIDGKALWFLALLLILYLITPILFYLKKCQKQWPIILFALMAWSFGFIVGLEGPAKHIQFGLCRTPCYLVGFIMADYILTGKRVKLRYTFLPLVFTLVICVIINKLTSIQITYFWIEGMVLLFVFVLIIRRFSHTSKLCRCLSFMGVISLESYCTNVLLLSFFLCFSYTFYGINLNEGNWAYYIVGSIFCVIVSLIVNRLSKWILSLIIANQ